MKLGAVTLAAGAAADYELSEGKLTLHPATGAAALKTAGAWSITVTAAGYSDSTVNQSVLNGAAASIAVTVQPVPGSFDGGLFATQPAVTLKDQYGNTVAAGAGSNANVTASIKTGDTWSLGGTLTKAAVSGVAAFSDLTHSVRQAGAKMTFACDGKTADSNSFDIIIPVADLAAIAGNGQAAFTFSASPGAASVRLHKSSASAAAGFADTGVSLDAASTSALVTGLTNDTQYWFKLVVTGGLYAGGSNVATATPGVVAATVITASTAGGDGKVNIAEKAAGFNVVAQSTASAGKLYLVPDGVYADEAALDAAKIVSAPITAANTNVTLSVAPAAALADAATYKVYAVDGTHYLSSGVDAFITDFTAPALSSAQKATSNSNASYAKAGNTVTYTLNMSEAVTAVINTGAAMSNATGAITDLATESSSSKTIDGTVANGDNGAVALTAGGYTFADAAGNTSLVAYTDINTAAANVITADTTVPTAVIPSVSSGSNNSTALVITFSEALFVGGTALTDSQNVKTYFAYDGNSGNYTGAVYATALNTVTLAFTGAENGKMITPAAATLTDIAGNAYVPQNKIYNASQTKWVDSGSDITPPTATFASTGASNITLTYTEALYSGGSAINNAADVKDKFTAAGASITSAIYNTPANTVTFTLSGAAAGNTVAANTGALTDAAGNAYVPITYYYHNGIDKWSSNSDVIAPTATFASTGATNITLTYTEALYDNTGTAIADSADIKEKFSISGASITSATYNTSDNGVTFVLSGAGANASVAANSGALCDAAGNSYVPVTYYYDEGADKWVKAGEFTVPVLSSWTMDMNSNGAAKNIVLTFNKSVTATNLDLTKISVDDKPITGTNAQALSGATKTQTSSKVITLNTLGAAIVGGINANAPIKTSAASNYTLVLEAGAFTDVNNMQSAANADFGSPSTFVPDTTAPRMTGALGGAEPLAAGNFIKITFDDYMITAADETANYSITTAGGASLSDGTKTADTTGWLVTSSDAMAFGDKVIAGAGVTDISSNAIDANFNIVTIPADASTAWSVTGTASTSTSAAPDPEKFAANASSNTIKISGSTANAVAKVYINGAYRQSIALDGSGNGSAAVSGAALAAGDTLGYQLIESGKLVSSLVTDGSVPYATLDGAAGTALADSDFAVNGSTAQAFKTSAGDITANVTFINDSWTSRTSPAALAGSSGAAHNLTTGNGLAGALAAGQTIQAAIVNANGNTSAAISCGTIPAAPAALAIPAVTGKSNANYITSASAADQSINATFAVAPSAGTINFTLKSAGSAQTVTASFAANTASTVTNATGLNVNGLTTDGQLAELSATITNTASGNTSLSYSQDTTGLIVDKTSPDAPTAVAVVPAGGTVVANTLNTTNTNMTASASISAGQAAGGTAKLKVGGTIVATDNSIAAEDTGVTFDLGKSDNAALQTAVAAGGVVTVELFDLSGNSTTSAVANPTLVVDYVLPAAPVVSSPAITANLNSHGNTSDHINNLLKSNFADFKANVANTAAGNEAGTLYVKLSDTAAHNATDGGTAIAAAAVAADRGNFANGAIDTFAAGNITLTAWIIDAAGNPSSNAVSVLTGCLDLTAPTLSTASKATSNSNASYAKAGNTVTYTLNMSEAVTAVINTGAAMSNATGAITDLAAAASSSKTIVGTVANGDNGAVALNAGNYKFADAAGNSFSVAYTDVNTAASNVITADTTAPTATIPTGTGADNNSGSFVMTFTEALYIAGTALTNSQEVKTYFNYNGNPAYYTEAIYGAALNTVTFTLTAENGKIISPSADTLTDAAGNAYVPQNKIYNASQTKWVESGSDIIPPTATFASTSATNITLTYTEALYDNTGTAIGDSADIKEKFSVSGASITSATYNTSDNGVTFVLSGAGANAAVAANTGALRDAAGNAYVPVTYYYDEGADKWVKAGEFTVPVLSSWTMDMNSNGAAKNIVLTFNKSVNTADLDLSKISVDDKPITGTNAQALSGAVKTQTSSKVITLNTLGATIVGGINANAPIKTSAASNYTLVLEAGAFTDVNNMQSAANADFGNPSTFVADTTAPRMTGAVGGAEPLAAGNFIKITFDDYMIIGADEAVNYSITTSGNASLIDGTKTADTTGWLVTASAAMASGDKVAAAAGVTDIGSNAVDTAYNIVTVAADATSAWPVTGTASVFASADPEPAKFAANAIANTITVSGSTADAIAKVYINGAYRQSIALDGSGNGSAAVSGAALAAGDTLGYQLIEIGKLVSALVSDGSVPYATLDGSAGTALADSDFAVNGASAQAFKTSAGGITANVTFTNDSWTSRTSPAELAGSSGAAHNVTTGNGLAGALAAGQTIQAAIVNANGNTSAAISCGIIPAAPTALAIPAVATKSIPNYINTASATDQSINATFAVAPSAGTINFTLKSAGSAQTATASFAANTASTVTNATGLNVNGLTADGQLAELSATITNTASGNTSLSYSQDTTGIIVDKTAPDAPTAVAVVPAGGTVVANTLNTTNTNMTASASISAGQATGGSAKLKVGGTIVATDNSIAAEDTGVTFDLGKIDNAALQTAVAAGGVVTVELFDLSGNSSVSAVSNPTLVVDYVLPAAPVVSSPAITANLNSRGNTSDHINNLLKSNFADFKANVANTAAGNETGTLYVKLSDTAAHNATDGGTAIAAAAAAADRGNFAAGAIDTFAAGNITLTAWIVDAAGNPSSNAVSVLTGCLDLTAPTLSTASKATSNSNASYAKAGNTVTYTLNMSESVTAVINTGASLSNAMGALTDLATASSSSKTIVGTVSNGDNGAVALTAGSYTFKDAAGNALSVAYTDVNTAASDVITADTTAPTATIPSATGGTNNSTALVITFTEALYIAGTALTNSQDVKTYFAYDGNGANYTSAIYGTAGNTVTFAFTAAENGMMISPSADTLTDAAGNAYVPQNKLYNASQTKWVDSGSDIIPPTATFASAGATNITLTYTEALYDNTGTAIPNSADIKEKFSVSGASITSATYNTSDNGVTFVLSGAGANAAVAANTGALRDAAGNAYVPVTYYYDEGADKWVQAGEFTVPVLSSWTMDMNSNGAAKNIVLTFNKSVNTADLDLTKISVDDKPITGPNAQALSGASKTQTSSKVITLNALGPAIVGGINANAPIKTSAASNYTLVLDAGAFTDVNNMQSAANADFGNPSTFVPDTTAPRMTGALGGAEPLAAGNFIKITFDDYMIIAADEAVNYSITTAGNASLIDGTKTADTTGWLVTSSAAMATGDKVAAAAGVTDIGSNAVDTVYNIVTVPADATSTWPVTGTAAVSASADPEPAKFAANAILNTITISGSAADAIAKVYINGAYRQSIALDGSGNGSAAVSGAALAAGDTLGYQLIEIGKLVSALVSDGSVPYATLDGSAGTALADSDFAVNGASAQAFKTSAGGITANVTFTNDSWASRTVPAPLAGSSGAAHNLTTGNGLAGALAAGQTIQAAIVNANGNTSAAISCGTIPAAPAALSIPAVVTKSISNYINTASATDQSINATFAVAPSAGTINFTLKSAGSAQTATASFAANTASTVTNATGLNVNGLTTDGQLAELSATITNTASGNTSLSYSQDTTGLIVDKTAPDAPTAVAVVPVGGTVVADTLNTTNTNMTATAVITVGQATGGSAKLKVGGNILATDSAIAGGDNSVTFDLGTSDNAALQTAVAAGGVVTVELFDLSGNSSVSAVSNPTLVVDYVLPAAPVVSSPAITANLNSRGNTSDHINNLLKSNFADFKANVSNTAAGNEAGTLYVKLSDIAAHNATDGGTAIAAAAAAADRGNFANSAIDTFTAGNITLTAWIVDAAGNPSSNAVSVLTGCLDLSAPTASIPAATGSDNNLTALVMSFSEPLYVSGSALTDSQNVKAYFTYDGTAGNYTGALYGTSANTVTFAFTAAENGKMISPAAATLTDAAGNAYTPQNKIYNASQTRWVADGSDITPPSASIASSGATNIKLTYTEALYDNTETAIADLADIKSKYTSAGATITSATYNISDNSVTFVLSGAGIGSTVAANAAAIFDAAGNGHVPVTYYYHNGTGRWNSNSDITSSTAVFASAGATNITLAFTEALYDNAGAAIADAADIKGKFTASVASITSAVYNTSDNTVTFVLSGAAANASIAANAGDLCDAAGNAYVPVTYYYDEGADKWVKAGEFTVPVLSSWTMDMNSNGSAKNIVLTFNKSVNTANLDLSKISVDDKPITGTNAQVLSGASKTQTSSKVITLSSLGAAIVGGINANAPIKTSTASNYTLVLDAGAFTDVNSMQSAANADFGNPSAFVADTTAPRMTGALGEAQPLGAGSFIKISYDDYMIIAADESVNYSITTAGGALLADGTKTADTTGWLVTSSAAMASGDKVAAAAGVADIGSNAVDTAYNIVTVPADATTSWPVTGTAAVSTSSAPEPAKFSADAISNTITVSGSTANAVAKVYINGAYRQYITLDGSGNGSAAVSGTALTAGDALSYQLIESGKLISSSVNDGSVPYATLDGATGTALVDSDFAINGSTAQAFKNSAGDITANVTFTNDSWTSRTSPAALAGSSGAAHNLTTGNGLAGALAAGQTIQAAIVNANGNTSSAISCGTIPAAPTALAIPAVASKSNANYINTASATDQSINATFALAPSAGTINFTLKSVGSAQTVTASFAANTASTVTNATGLNVNGLTSDGQLAELSAAITTAVSGNTSLSYSQDTTGLVLDKTAPDAPTAVAVVPVGGTVVANALNTTNTNMTASASISVGQATGGSAKLKIGVTTVATDSSIAAGDTGVTFDIGAADNAALQTAIAAGGVVTVELSDAAGNSSTSAVGNPTLTVDYVAPAAPVVSSPVITANLSSRGNASDHINNLLKTNFADFKVNAANTNAGNESGTLYVQLSDSGAHSATDNGTAIAAGAGASDKGNFAAGAIDTFVAGNITVTVWVVDAAGNPSSTVVNELTGCLDLTLPSLSTALKATSNSNASYAKAGNTVTYTLNMSEAVTAVINTGAAMSNISGAITDLATTSSSVKTIVGTVAGGDNGAVALTAGNYTFSDAAGNTSVVAYTDINAAAANAITADTTVPTITGAALAGDNVYIDITFSEGVYKTGSAGLTAGEFAVTFTQNGGVATNATISSVKKNDNVVEGSATALSGGETTIRAFLAITGIPSGVETIEIKPASSTSIYDVASNAMANTQTTGVKTFNGQTPPTITNATLASDNSYVDIEFSEGVYNGSGQALTAGAFALDFAQNAGNATGAGIVTVTKIDTNPLAGGETAIRFNLTITGIPSGVETISVKPASGASVYDATAVAMLGTQFSAARTLNDKLAPADPTIPQLLLLSFNNVTGDVVAASEITSSESSYLDIYISSTSPDAATVPTASEASPSAAHNGTLMTVAGVPKTFTDSIYYRFRDALGNKSNWVRKCTVGLTPGTYKKVSAPNPTVSGESYLSGNTLQVGTGSATAIYDVTYNSTAKNIMNAIEATDTFTIDASGLISAIDDSIANDGAANSIALTSSECSATVTVLAASAYQTSLTGTATAVTVQKGFIDITGITATTFNITAAADVKTAATGKTLAAVSGAYTIEIAGASSAAVSGAVTALTISSAVGTLDIGAEVGTLNANEAITTLNINSGGVSTLNIADTKTIATLNISAVKTSAMTISATGAGAVTTASITADLTSCTLTVNDSVPGSAAIGTLNIVAQTTGFTTAGTGTITTMNINGAVPSVNIGSAVTTLDVKANVTSTLTAGAAIGTLTSSAAATVTTLTVSSGGSITSNTGAGNLTITNIDQSGVASVKTIPLGSMTTAVASVKGHSASALTLTSSATLSSCTIAAGVVNIEGMLATTFNVNASAATTLTAGGKTFAAVNGAYTITLGSSGSAITSATVNGAVTTLVANCAVTTLTVNAVVTTLNVNADNTTVSVGTSAGTTNIVVANVSTVIQNAINTITVNIAGVTTTGKTFGITAYATANLTSLLITTGSNATQAKASAALKIAGANPLATGITWQGVSTDNSGTTAYSTTIGSPVITFEIKKSATVTLTRL